MTASDAQVARRLVVELNNRSTCDLTSAADRVVTSAAPEPTDEQRAVAWAALNPGDDRWPDHVSVHERLEVDAVARALAVAVAAEREKVLGQIEKLIQDEVQAEASDPGWDITVWVPEKAGEPFHQQAFDAIADLAYELQPAERDWDIGCMSIKGHPRVAVRQLQWVIDAARRIREVSR